MSNKLYIAAAGAGKTRKIIEEVINTKEKVLIVTYTNNNTNQIKERIKKRCGYIPDNIAVRTWMSFLIKDGINPYQGGLFKNKVNGIIISDNKIKFFKRTEEKYYVKGTKIYSNKISECVCYLDEINSGLVIERISKLYKKIYIDEVQDLVGYDYEVLKLLIENKLEVIMVGDPRQCAYTTHNTKKNRKFNNGNIKEYLEQNCLKNIKIDEITLNKTYRCNEKIMKFANLLYPQLKETMVERKITTITQGVFVIDKDKINLYLEKYNAVQLRYDSKTKINNKYDVYNFGEAKGLEFDNILIYPTKEMWDWINDYTVSLAFQTRAKFYIAITRAKYRVLIVKRDDRKCALENFDIYEEV